MDDIWTAEQLAIQVIVWRMVLDGAVRAVPLAEEFERNARFVHPSKAITLVLLACLARAAGRPELVGGTEVAAE